MKNDNADIMLSVAIAKKKAVIMLSLIDQEEIYNDILKGILANMELERVLNPGRFRNDRGLKEYRDIKGKARFIMTDSQRFCVEFGEYSYVGYFPLGTRERIIGNVTEVVLYVSNAVAVGKSPKRIAINNFSILGISNITV